VAETVRELAAKAGSAGELVSAHARLLAGWMAQSGYRDGSPMATVLLENAPADAAITAAGLAAQAEWRAIVAERLVADGFPPARAERLATLAIAALDGALLQARVQQSGAPLEAAAAEFERLLGSAQGAR
jgi:TetR/AcrR family transcriptional repressor of lmrAB and yxaGH operons